MATKLKPPSLALAGVMLAAGWYWAVPSADPVGAQNAPFLNWVTSPNVRAPLSAPEAEAMARPSFGALSPFGATQSASEPVRAPGQGSDPRRKALEQLLHNYRLGELSPDEKIRIKESLRELKQEAAGRALIIDAFFSSSDPQLAETLYGLIRDADLKERALLEGLIQRDSTGGTLFSKARIVDLIADLSTQQGAGYSPVIDGYLAQVALSPDAQLSQSATSQRIWYVAQHQPNNLATLKQYIYASAPTVREEMYSLIESRIANQTLAGKTELASALSGALQADYLGASAEEKARIAALLEALAGNGPAL